MLKLLFVLLLVVNIYAFDMMDGVIAYKKGNYEEALKIFKELAQKGNSDASYNLGTMYMYGKGAKQDYSKAYQSFVSASKAGKNGMPQAEYLAGYMLENGLGVKQDYKQACEYYKKSADKKYKLAMYALANFYEKGTGCKKNIKQAKQLYITLANASMPAAQYKLGKILEKEKNYKEAYKWYKAAEKKEYPSAKTAILNICKKDKNICKKQ